MIDEKELVGFNALNIDNSIRKSRADRDYVVYRGVKDIDWIENPNVGGTFTEDAFGSFSLDFNRALKYSDPEKPILFQLKLRKGMNALYLDKAENEILCPRKSTYIITKIESFKIENINKRVKIYSIEKI
ncbi:hypothetical protein MmiHf6_17120 [Methanimicrococcus hongohii]|uniref:ADP ribosyltransferase domain-containing protein n=1 Tax=Methanimicrococcus hongohii TaxID=3028295 RepID=A0AA96ZUJ0_9EURY|nr:ADP-ribosyltransferase [Methanimicrococcus sp. Hf6]WNY24381.1 hypothetical protein MmiHf6_17120 [Methanimicrococcus sp. Hf6]